MDTCIKEGFVLSDICMTTIIRRANAKGGSDTDSGPQAVA